MKFKKLLASTAMAGVIVSSAASSLGGVQAVLADSPQDNIGQVTTIDSSQRGKMMYLEGGLTRQTLDYIGISSDGRTMFAGVNGKRQNASVNNDYVGYNYITSGSAVYVAQAFLIHNGYSIILDGVFGENTRKAVASFQSKVGLSADGIVGPKTWKALAAAAQA